ncbi:MAG: exodeoxyribonuclease VII small subunit [Saprospiraceae bacterium]|nr:exodeoxyribonuclease VII small subunit [Candidatus Brachybacter algidus]
MFQRSNGGIKSILTRIESEDLEIDAIPALINRAKELQIICQEKLTQVQLIIDDDK